MEIQHLKHSEIDLSKWNKAIRDAYNGIVFAFSWYLDIVADNWHALVSEDYSYVMPLPVKHVVTIDYIFQPRFVNYLGIFSRLSITPDIVDQFLKALPYPFFDIQLSVHNPFNQSDAFTIKQKDIAKIDLIASYSNTKKRYTSLMKSGIVHAIAQRVMIQSHLSPNDFINFMRNEAVLQKKLHQDDLEVLRQLAVNAMRFRVGALYGAYSEHNMLVAVAFFVGSHNKICLLAAGVNTAGSETYAFPTLFDHYLEHHAELNLNLELCPDFSSVHDDWWANIGATYYSHDVLVQNNRPWYLKVLKI